MSQPNRPGSEWRLLAHTAEEAIEVANRGVFDELVVGEWLHAEQLDDGTWWLRIGDARVVVSGIETGPIDVDVIRGFYSEIHGSTTEHSVPVAESGEPKEPGTPERHN